MLEGVGSVYLGPPTELHLLDAEWASLRTSDDAALHWEWREIASRHEDRFALRRAADDRIEALWAGLYSRRLELADGYAYRLDRLEVRPDARGEGRGRLTMALICARAKELEAVRVILGAVPGERSEAFFASLGGVPGALAGWKVDSRLVPYSVAGDAFDRLIEFADELEG